MLLKIGALNIVLFLLLFFGPKFNGVENGLFFRLLVLVSLPLLVLLIVHLLLKKFGITRKTEIGLEGTLAGIVGIIILVYGIFETVRFAKASAVQDWSFLPLIWSAALGLILLALGKRKQFLRIN